MTSTTKGSVPMTIAEILAGMKGVWEGTYTVVGADGRLLESFPSRQEGWLERTDWTEKVVYRKPGGDVVQYFHAVVDGDDVRFGNDEIWGTTSRAGADMIVFRFGWTDRPDEQIVECSRPDGDYRTRLWQHFAAGRLSKLTIIEERRVPGQDPERWFQNT
jgi:hypothetical protein